MKLDYYDKLVKAIEKTGFSDSFNSEDFQVFRKVFQEREFKKGQKILWRGLKGYFYFIVGNGNISVSLPDGTSRKLMSGDYNGETFLLLDNNLFTNCYAEDDNTLIFFLTHSDFFEYFASKPEVRSTLENIAINRIKDTPQIAKADGKSSFRHKDSSMPVPATKIKITETTVEIKKEQELKAIVQEESIQETSPEPLKEEPSSEYVPELSEPQPSVASEEPVSPEDIKEKQDIEISVIDNEIIESTEEKTKIDDTTVKESPKEQEETYISTVSEQTKQSEYISGFESALLQAGFLKLMKPETIEKLKGVINEVEMSPSDEVEVVEEQDSLFIIIGHGKIQAEYFDKTGRSIGEIILNSGDFIGELNLLFSQQYTIRCTAITDSILYVIDKSLFFDELMICEPIRNIIEIRGLRKVFSKGLRTISSNPAMEKVLQDYHKRFNVSFFDEKKSKSYSKN